MTVEEKENIYNQLESRKEELEALVTEAVYGLNRNQTLTRAIALQTELNAVTALLATATTIGARDFVA